MKAKLLTSCIAALAMFGTGAAAMADSPKLYGKINSSLNSLDKEGAIKSTDISDNWELSSNASRLGVKGAMLINDNLKAIYKMEFEVFVDDGEKGGQTFSQRNIYGGFQGSWGTLVTGKHDTPLKLAQGKVDRFNDLPVGDIKNIMEGEDRADNVILYITPKLNGLALSIAAIPGEEDGADTENDSIADHRSIALTWSNEMISAALAVNDDVDGQDTLRAVADIKLDNFSIGLLWQNAEKVSDSSVDEDSYLISAEAKIVKDVKLKAQYGMTDYSNDNEHTTWSLGIDKKLGKNSKIYAYYSEVELESSTESKTDSTLGLGYEIKF